MYYLCGKIGITYLTAKIIDELIKTHSIIETDKKYCGGMKQISEQK